MTCEKRVRVRVRFRKTYLTLACEPRVKVRVL